MILCVFFVLRFEGYALNIPQHWLFPLDSRTTFPQTTKISPNFREDRSWVMLIYYPTHWLLIISNIHWSLVTNICYYELTGYDVVSTFTQHRRRVLWLVRVATNVTIRCRSTCSNAMNVARSRFIHRLRGKNGVAKCAMKINPFWRYFFCLLRIRKSILQFRHVSIRLTSAFTVNCCYGLCASVTPQSHISGSHLLPVGPAKLNRSVG